MVMLKRRRRGGLRELREQFGLSQAQVASELGASQPAVLKAERASDPQLGSVRRFVSAVGQAAGKPSVLRIVAEVGDQHWELEFPAGDDAESSILGTEPSKPGADDAEVKASLPPVSAEAVVSPRDSSRGVASRPPRAAREPARSVAESAAVWRLRAWDDPRLEDAFLNRSVVTLTADELGDLAALTDDASIRRRLLEWNPELSNQALGIRSRYVHVFRSEMAEGDVVVVPMSDRRVAVGIIASGYQSAPDEAVPELRHQRQASWLWTGSRDELDDDIRSVVNAPGTVCRIDKPDAVQRLLALTRTE